MTELGDARGPSGFDFLTTAQERVDGANDRAITAAGTLIRTGVVVIPLLVALGTLVTDSRFFEFLDNSRGAVIFGSVGLLLMAVSIGFAAATQLSYKSTVDSAEEIRSLLLKEIAGQDAAAETEAVARTRIDVLADLQEIAHLRSILLRVSMASYGSSVLLLSVVLCLAANHDFPAA